MARLNSDLFPMLNENLLAKLHFHNIFTVYDFMMLTGDDLVKRTELSFKEIESIKEQIFKNYGGKLDSAVDLYQKELCDYIPTGIETLDTMLEGGLLCGQIYEICGYSSAGKSQLCHWISMHATLCSSTEVHYIDASSNFCASRIQMILESAQEQSDKLIGKVMTNIKVYRVEKITHVFAILHGLTKMSKDEVERCKKIVIVDSLPVLFSTFISNDFNALLSNLSSVCRFFVNNCRGVVITVNTVKTEGGRTLDDAEKDVVVNTKPSLTNYWMNVPNVRLLMTNLDNNRRKVELWKSCQLKNGNNCFVSISDAGFSSLG